MSALIDRLVSLRVEHVMTPKVESVSTNASMADAARIMSNSNVRGLPVVDELGRCVGIITTMDFMARESEESCPYHPHDELHSLVADDRLSAVQIAEVPDARVQQYMSPAVQSISKSTFLLDAARCLCAEYIHRLLVLDDSGRPVGIVSTLDIVAALVNAVDERDDQNPFHHHLARSTK